MIKSIPVIVRTRSSAKQQRRRQSELIFVWALLAPALLVILLTFVAPLFEVLRNSITGSTGLTLEHFKRFLTDAYYLRILWRTFSLGFIATLLTLIPGYVLAHNLAFHPSIRWRNFILVITIVPLVVNLIVRIFGWLAILAPEGTAYSMLNNLGITDRPIRLLYSEPAIVIGFVHSHIIFMTIAIAGTLMKIDSDLLRAAQNLGANPWGAFLKVVLPLSVPGIAAGSLICFALNVSDFVAPALLGGQRNRMMTYLIYEQQLFLANSHFAAAQTVILMVTTAIALIGAMIFASIYSRRWFA